MMNDFNKPVVFVMFQLSFPARPGRYRPPPSAPSCLNGCRSWRRQTSETRWTKSSSILRHSWSVRRHWRLTLRHASLNWLSQLWNKPNFGYQILVVMNQTNNGSLSGATAEWISPRILGRLMSTNTTFPWILISKIRLRKYNGCLKQSDFLWWYS